MKKEIITTLNAPAPIGPYNQAIKVGNTLYVSGQIPINAKTMEIFNGTIKEETELVIKILELAGISTRELQMYQIAASMEAQNTQQEKS